MKSGVRKVKSDCKMKSIDGNEIDLKENDEITVNPIWEGGKFYEVSSSDNSRLGVCAAKQIKGKSVRV